MDFLMDYGWIILGILWLVGFFVSDAYYSDHWTK